MNAENPTGAELLKRYLRDPLVLMLWGCGAAGVGCLVLSATLELSRGELILTLGISIGLSSAAAMAGVLLLARAARLGVARDEHQGSSS